MWCYGRAKQTCCVFGYTGSSEAVEETAVEGSVMLSAAERQNQMQHRANATVHVCWHRNTSVSAKDMHVALQVCCISDGLIIKVR